jgi:beta-glucosidase
MVMPSGSEFWGDNLTEAVMNGSVPETRLNDMATRIIASWYYVGLDDVELPSVGVGMHRWTNESYPYVDAVDHSQPAKDVLLQGAIESHVLVKNNGILPLQSPKLLNLYGYSATVPKVITPVPGLGEWALGAASSNVESMLCGFGLPGGCPDMLAIAPNGTIISGGGSGAVTPRYISAPHDALVQYAMENGIALFWDYENVNATSAVFASNDACVVFVNAWATEGTDRPGLSDEYSDTLVGNIADQCVNTVVVIHNAGVRLVDAFYDHPNVSAIIYAHLPGQDSGVALTKILFGEVSPSAKLPYTVAKKASDYGDVLRPYMVEEGDEDFYFPQDEFSEGPLLDYKYFDAMDITPRFEFGFGLSYTTFSYSNLVITDVGIEAGCASGPIEMGGRTDLWDTMVTVSAEITNTGSVTGAEVAQLYLIIPNMSLNRESQPAVVGRQLRGFEKIMLQPGETGTVSFELNRRDISVWDVVRQEWCVGGGQYVVNVGGSSRNLPLGGTFDV